jgi:hypothetical protein
MPSCGGGGAPKTGGPCGGKLLGYMPGKLGMLGMLGFLGAPRPGGGIMGRCGGGGIWLPPGPPVPLPPMGNGCIP